MKQLENSINTFSNFESAPKSPNYGSLRDQFPWSKQSVSTSNCIQQSTFGYVLPVRTDCFIPQESGLAMTVFLL